eukprot:6491077-Amphidinium_carterae.1
MQAQLSIAKGGLGLRSPVLHAAGAYVSSVAQSSTLTQLVWTNYDPESQNVEYCRKKLREYVDPAVPLDMSIGTITQKEVSLAVDRSLLSRLAQVPGAPPHWTAHLALTQLPTAGVWLTAPPLVEEDSKLDSVLFQTAVSRRLRMPILTEQGLCPLCGEIMDVFGDHALVCSCSGDRNARHHHVQNLVANAAGSVGLRPEKEKMGLLPEHTGLSGVDRQLRRPADIYLPRGHLHKRTAYDLAVTSGLNQRSVQQVAREPASIFTHYEDLKCTYLNTYQQCMDAGIDFHPLVFEAHGGAMSPTARTLLEFISRSAPTADGMSATSFALGLAQRISISLQRDAAQAVQRRVASSPPPLGQADSWRDALSFVRDHAKTKGFERELTLPDNCVSKCCLGDGPRLVL